MSIRGGTNKMEGLTGKGLMAECMQTENGNLTKGKKYRVIHNYQNKQLLVTDNYGFEKYYKMSWFHIKWKFNV